MAQVILVTSGRGGAGKSTVCAYLGAALAACGKKVLLIEGSHRSLDVLLGAQDRVVFDLADALERRCELGEAMVDACGVRLLCAPLDLQPIIDGAACRELRAALEEHFDFILIEVDGGDRVRLTAFAACADRAVIVSAGGRGVRARGADGVRFARRGGRRGYPFVRQPAHARLCEAAAHPRPRLADRPGLRAAHRGASVR